MEEAKTMKTPMSSSIKLDKDEKVKRIFRYLKGTIDIGLWYPKSDNFELIGFSDANFAGCRVERKSTSDTCHFLGHSLVSWHSKKAKFGSLSMAETIYIAVARFNSISVRLGLLVGFHSLLFGAQGKRPTEPSQPDQMEANRKASCDDFQVDLSVSGACISFTGDLPIMSTIIGVEIRLSPESICRIFYIPLVGLWCMSPRFGPLCRVSSLERLFKGIHCGLNSDEQTDSCGVSDDDAYDILLLEHDQVLPYGRFLTRVFKDFGVDLSIEMDFEAPTSYDTYNEQSLGRMKFKKVPDGS
ncbi:putative mitochondrial protein [Vitis vinifera]|uniref:Putative mitochondrial protein n=1 Tax=Vitis vinifera TaxID=29760 RepID=A0A438HGL4_VITVI|nr:putative mitochondrial protein [Vitis vinifera]